MKPRGCFFSTVLLRVAKVVLKEHDSHFMEALILQSSYRAFSRFSYGEGLKGDFCGFLATTFLQE